MNHSKFSPFLAILLSMTLVRDSPAATWRGTSAINSARADLRILDGKPTGWRSYQSECLVESNAWHGLLPLRTTREDVERLLGPAKGLLAGSYAYETKDEKVRVVYSEGSCSSSLEGRWNVPIDTVLSITVFPNTTVLVSALHIDKGKYSRTQETHPENWLYYVSTKKGVMVHAMQHNGRIVTLF